MSKKLISKYNIKPSNIVGHSDIAPLRKKDPGEKFPWKELANSKIGIWHNLKTKKLKKNRALVLSAPLGNLYSRLPRGSSKM